MANENFNDIPKGNRIPTQIPLNVKEWCKDEETLSDLGVDNNLAFTYHDNIKIFCLSEKTLYVWREVNPGEENTGLIEFDFTYPSDTIIYDVDYSNKVYNFFKILTNDELIEYIDNNNNTYSILNLGTGSQIYKNSTTIDNNTQFNIRSLDLSSVGTGSSIVKDINSTLDTTKLNFRLKSITSSSVGSGQSLVKDIDTISNPDNLNIRLKSIKSEDSSINITSNTDDISLSSNIICNNVGSSGEGIFKNKTGNIFNFKKIKSSDNSITITGNLNDIDIKIANINRFIPKNSGFISGLDLNSGVIGNSLPVSGDITSAIISDIDTNGTTILVTLNNSMITNNYYVRCFMESLGNIANDNNAGGGVFKIISPTQFYYSNSEMIGSGQNLKLHLEILTLD